VPDKILIVDDNPRLLEAVQQTFEKEGYQVIVAYDGQEGMRVAYAERPDLVILDVMMPRLDGWQVCQRVREMSDVPIIMLTAKMEEEDIIKGLTLGADDYLTKPFGVNELLARVRAVLRRARTGALPSSSRVTYHDDYLFIDLDARRVVVNGELVDLTPTEYKLLALLVENEGRALEFREILENVWGFEYVDDVEYVRVYVWHLRRKIEPDPKRPRYLINELNVGYRFEPRR
jgi:two-component system KDP operon response regulator KdpE